MAQDKEDLLIQFERLCVNGKLDEVREFYQNNSSWLNINADMKDLLGNTIEFGHLDVAYYLITDCQVNPHALDGHALAISCHHGCLEMVQYLVEKCDADINASQGRPLIFSVNAGRRHIVRYLLEQGADYQNFDGVWSEDIYHACHDVWMEIQQDRKLDQKKTEEQQIKKRQAFADNMKRVQRTEPVPRPKRRKFD